ncbi:hypothetical protein K440DRAFT_64859 [Wilcoxina mikolae CBS 423.85]|nr:hypothetical protein K440DRAFT_64859 [Wilcoxina mikolae CBS 423.85]
MAPFTSFHNTSVSASLPQTQIQHSPRSADNNSMSRGEISGLSVSVVGVFFTAIGLFKGWKFWRRRKVRANNTPPSRNIQLFESSLPTTLVIHNYGFSPATNLSVPAHVEFGGAASRVFYGPTSAASQQEIQLQELVLPQAPSAEMSPSPPPRSHQPLSSRAGTF